MDKNKILSLSREESSAIKGLLICLVILGHNHFYVSVLHSGSWHWLYSFHVSIFFILPFFYSDKKLSWNRLKSSFIRLFWPYTYMFFFLFIVKSIMQSDYNINLELFNTWITGNFYKQSVCVGFQYLWFLPTMFSMLFIKEMYSSVTKSVKIFLFLIGLSFFILSWVFLYGPPYLDLVNKKAAQFSLFSFMLGFAMFFLGLITRNILDRVKFTRFIFVTLLFTMLLMLVLMIYNQSVDRRYLAWFSRATFPVMFFALLFHNRHIINCRFFREIGKLSFPIYLFHQPINFAICTILGSIIMPPIFKLLLSYTICILGTFLLTKLLFISERLKRTLFPR